MASKNQFVTFNNGNKCPILGLGTLMRSKTGETEEAIIIEEAIKFAIDVGYRHFDCAIVYENEIHIGKAIKEKLDAGVLKREDLFITSKLWNTFHQPDYVETVLKKTLSDLQLNYLDLYLLQWPVAFQEGKLGDNLFPRDANGAVIEGTGSYIETWKAIEKLVEKGLVKSIGLGNFNKKQIENLLNEATVKPVTNQVECHAYLNQSKLKEFCAEHNIILTAYAPLGSPSARWREHDDPNILEDSTIKEIADKYNKSAAQILIKYQIQRGIIVVPKSATKSHIKSNFDVWDFTLKQSDIEEIDGLDCNWRVYHTKWDQHFKDFPFNDEY